MKNEIKKRGSWASYRDPKDKNLFRCDTDELAEKLLNWGEIPMSLGNVKAMEIAILAEAYLRLRNRWPIKQEKSPSFVIKDLQEAVEKLK